MIITKGNEHMGNDVISREEYQKMMNMLENIQRQLNTQAEQEKTAPSVEMDMLSKLAGVETQMNKVMEAVQNIEERTRIINLHLNYIYAAKTPEEILQHMSNMGKEVLGVEDCKVYNVDTFDKDKIYTVDANNERQYVNLDNSSMIYQAIVDNKPAVDNNFSGGRYSNTELGDNIDNKHVNNVMVVPIEDKLGDVISVVVAKDKGGGYEGFTQEDAKLFDLKDGQLGATFRIGLENRSLLQMATTDELTRLSNREGMNRFLENVVINRAKNEEPVTTIMFDIDHFKRFNDTYGHDIGDKCLKQVAEILKDNVRQGADSGVFRWGGEEMVVILPTDEATAFDIAERLRHAVEETPLVVNEATKETTQITLSAGISAFKPMEAYDLNRNNIREEFDTYCFKNADNHLYEAKETGRNKVCASPEVMLTHQSMESPTKITADYLNMIDVTLTQDKDGFILYDNIDNNVVKSGMDNPKEIVSALKDYTEANVVEPLRTALDNYNAGAGIESNFDTRSTDIREWADFLKEAANDPDKAKVYADFINTNKDDIAIVSTLAYHQKEIKLDRIAVEADIGLTKEKEPVTLDESTLKDLNKHYADRYNELYDNRNSTAGYSEAVSLGDELIKTHKEWVQQLNEYNHDFISSDREAASFAYALADIGLIEDFTKDLAKEDKETSSPNKTKKSDGRDDI
jgi:diguanylate cyclase (GGDEF)-like protein